jgi:DNA repair exonuclease SbcCD nuclease subunit
MKIQVVSDLHLEFSDVFLKNEEGADVLILSGDIFVAEKLIRPEAGKPYRDFLSRVSFQFPHVIYVAGNHEFYGSGKWVGSIENLRQICGQYPNIHFLERNTVEIDDIVFVGGTLWTDMNKCDPLTLHAVRDMMNDYRAIRNDEKGYTNLKPADTVERHRKTLEYIQTVVDQNKDRKCVVVGHHTPSFQSCHPQYAHDTLMNGAYHSDLSEFILDRPQIKLWTHGHTHHCFDYMIGETRVVCNPRGYRTDNWEEDTGFDPNFVVEI